VDVGGTKGLFFYEKKRKKKKKENFSRTVCISSVEA